MWTYINTPNTIQGLFVCYSGSERLAGFWGSRAPTSFVLHAPSSCGTRTTTTANRMATSLSPQHEATILPSLPPSPSLLDEIFSHRRSWNVRPEQLDPESSRPSSSGSVSGTKGKGKQTLEVDQQRAGTHEAYPPMTDDAAETRRVEEVRASSAASKPPLI